MPGAFRTQGRFVLALFGLVLAGSTAYALLGIVLGIPAILMMPWRLYASETLHATTLAMVREQFSPRNFFARPPPFLVNLFDELQLGPAVNAVYMLVALIVGIAFLFIGAGIFIGGLGQFGGAGATVSWPLS